MPLEAPAFGPQFSRTGYRGRLQLYLSPLYIVPFATILLGSMVILFMGGMLTPDRGAYYFLFALIAAYLYVECNRFLVRDLPFKLLAPPIMATILCFYQSYILGALWSLYDPYIYDRFAVYVSNVWTDLAELAPLIAIGAFMMWRGFDIVEKPAYKFGSTLSRKGYIRQTFTPNIGGAVVLQVISLTVTLASIVLGIYGFAGSAELRMQNAAIVQFMALSSSLGALSLLLLFGGLFQRTRHRDQPLGLWIICLVALVMQFALGAVSGFKSQMVIPFITIGIAYYFVNQRILIAMIPIIAVAIFISYSVIEPYRAYLNQNNMFGSSQLSNLVNAIDRSTADSSTSATTDTSTYSQIVMRADLSGLTVVGISYAQSTVDNKDIAQPLAESIVMAPIYAYIPRALWADKPIYSTGVWFNQAVLGNSSDVGTSVGMGAITSLFFMGGWFGIAVGFFIIGCLQGFVYHGFIRQGAGGVLVYLTTATGLGTIPGDLGPALQGFLQIAPIMMIGQFLLLHPLPAVTHFAARRLR